MESKSVGKSFRLINVLLFYSAVEMLKGHQRDFLKPEGTFWYFVLSNENTNCILTFVNLFSKVGKSVALTSFLKRHCKNYIILLGSGSARYSGSASWKLYRWDKPDLAPQKKPDLIQQNFSITITVQLQLKKLLCGC